LSANGGNSHPQDKSTTFYFLHQLISEPYRALMAAGLLRQLPAAISAQTGKKNCFIYPFTILAFDPSA
jgi:hypothetical protein